MYRQWIPTAPVLAALLAPLAFVAAGPAAVATAGGGVGPEAFNMTRVAQLELATCTDVSVSAAGDLAFVGRAGSGVTIVDLSDPAAPAVLATWTHPTLPVVVNDPRPIDPTRLLISNESGDTFGLFELDLADPSAPVLAGAYGPPEMPLNVHNLWVDGTHAYLAGYGGGLLNEIIDVSTPGGASHVASIPVDGFHDHTVVDETLYVAGAYEGTWLFDVSTPSQPLEIGHWNASTPDTSFYAHNAYPIGNSGYVLITEEVAFTGGPFVQGSLRVVDFSNPSAPVQVFRWFSENAKNDPSITVHNVYVVGEFAFLSHYQDGVRVFDVSDPAQPVEVGWYDTFPATPLSLFEGCWGVDPFHGLDRIVASDRTHGLFVLSFNGARRTTLTGIIRDRETLAPVAGAGVKTLSANRSTFADGAGAYTLHTGSGVHRIEVSAPGYETATLTLTLEPLATRDEEVLLAPSGSIAVGDAAAGPAASRLLLAPPSPNPLEESTVLRFRVPDAARGQDLDLGIYAVTGRRLRTLASGRAMPGEAVRRWDGRDAAGARVAAGLYVARLRVGDRETRQKVLIGP